MNTEEIYDKVLELYTDKSSDNNFLSHPFIQEGSIYATNRFEAIRIKGTSEDYDEMGNPGMSDFFESDGTQKRFSFEDILEKVIEAPMISEYKKYEKKKCTECHGEGQVEWEYKDWTKMLDCPKCDGEGYEEGQLEPTGNMIKDPIFLVRVGNRDFKLDNIVKLLTTMKFLKSDYVILKSRESVFENVIFAINEDVSVAMMAIQKA